MMNKRLLLLVPLAAVSVDAFAQDVKAKIDVQAKNAATKERAAKADLFIQNQHIISDTVRYDGGDTLKKKTHAAITKKKKSKKGCVPARSK